MCVDDMVEFLEGKDEKDWEDEDDDEEEWDDDDEDSLDFYS
jgi:hypothetical protein